MKRIAGGGWRALSFTGHRSIALAPDEPPQWENLLRELELCDEDEALSCIKQGDLRGVRIVNFVRSCFHLRFVPEPVLAELGLQHSVESYFDNRNLGEYRPRRPPGNVEA